MPKYVPKVKEGDKIFNACPICSGKCSDYAWRNYKHCAQCHKLILQGNSKEDTRIIRLQQKSNEIENIKQENEGYKRNEVKIEYDFENLYPAGILVRSNSKEEAKVIKDVYKEYFQIYGHINEFNSLINGILSASLESYRINEQLRKDSIKPKLSVNDKKNYFDMKSKMEDQIIKSNKLLQDIKETRSSNSSNIIIEEFKKLLSFHHERDQEYMGVGICPTCDKRIIFKTNFSTFKAKYEEIIKKHIVEMRNTQLYDNKTLDAFQKKILDRLTDDALLDTYMIYHTRQIEKTLI